MLIIFKIGVKKKELLIKVTLLKRQKLRKVILMTIKYSN